MKHANGPVGFDNYCLDRLPGAGLAVFAGRLEGPPSTGAVRPERVRAIRFSLPALSDSDTLIAL